MTDAQMLFTRAEESEYFTGVSLECYSLFTLDSLSAAPRSHHVGAFIWSGSAGWLVSQHFFEWLSQTQIFAFL